MLAIPASTEVLLSWALAGFLGLSTAMEVMRVVMRVLLVILTKS